MDDNETAAVGGGYPIGELATAFVTATSHEDADTRCRADARVADWLRVLRGMAEGTLTVGSRTPVAGLPAWVTPTVVRGGFTTGETAAGGPLRPDEQDLAARIGVAPQRAALFAHHLTERGLTGLWDLLDSGHYRVEVPEEAALLSVAWLLRTGDRAGAVALVDTLAPFADRLRFTPAPAAAPALDSSMVYRCNARQVRDAVAGRRPNERIEAMREALTVWGPFGDRLLAHWLDSVVDGRVAARMSKEWRQRGTRLLAEYHELAAAHTRCTKHRNPKQNLAVLRTALREVLSGPLSARRRGLLQHAVDAMLRRRGRPGSAPHTALRARQAADAVLPTHHEVAGIVAGRLADLPPGTGVPDLGPLTRPVDDAESRHSGVPAGTPVPGTIRSVVSRALAAPVEQLIECGVVPSSQVLAELVPQIAAGVTTAGYPDEALRTLMAACYRAFRHRRSLLLLNLAHQVRLAELPWVAAVEPHRHRDDTTRRHSGATLRRLGELAVDSFPATILPNPLIRELDALAAESALELPLVEELAADIFVGTFTAKFLRAAKIAAELLGGSLYERYYGIDYRRVRAIGDTVTRRRGHARTSEGFAEICRRRAGVPAGLDAPVAANGMILEQSQILTTHNLAALVVRVGITPASGWPTLARRAFDATCRFAARAQGRSCPLTAVKDAAYAWRQALFFLSLCDLDQQAAFADEAEATVRAGRARLPVGLPAVTAGLRHTLDGGSFDEQGHAGNARRLLGWTTTAHWLCTGAG